MTLKSLNTQYLKPIRKVTVIGIGLLLATGSLLSPTRWCAEAAGFNQRFTETDNSIPALQGASAVTYLKEHKLYDSLTSALNAARTQQGDISVLARLFVNEQKLTASDGAARDFFGYSVAVSDSTVVVGTPDDNIGSGSAYVFNRKGGGWVEAQKLTASDAAQNDIFGSSVAVSGSTVVVGASLDTIGGNLFQGSAYVFNCQGGSWVEMQKLTASDGAQSDRFGYSVAISGSTILVGSPGDVNPGSAYVFNRQGENWVEAQKLTPRPGARHVKFGSSVAISGSTVVVGALSDTIGPNLFQGSAYVFNRQGGSWVEMQKLTASDAGSFDEFGYSVAVSGSTVVVSAPRHTIGPNIFQGSAYVFNRQGENWIEAQKLTASDGERLDGFGSSVAINDSTIIVSAIFDTIGGNLFQGSAYVFNRQGGSWVETQKLIASDGVASDLLGQSVAVSGSTVVVGAQSGGNSFQGSVYIFER